MLYLCQVIFYLCQHNTRKEIHLTQSIYKKRFLKRPIYKIPCTHKDCDKVIYTRSFNRKYCYKHVPNFKYKISKRSMDKRKLANSPYTKPVQSRRDCLKCNSKFDSISPNNRICPKCNIENDGQTAHKIFHGWRLEHDGFLGKDPYQGEKRIC